MGKELTADLSEYLKQYPDEIKETTLKLREFIWKLYPNCNEIIYNIKNTISIGFSISGRVCDTFVSIDISCSHVNFGFTRGSEIEDPYKILEGEGNLYRRMEVTDFSKFPQSYIKNLMTNAYLHSFTRLKSHNVDAKGKTITKSVSDRKKIHN